MTAFRRAARTAPNAVSQIEHSRGSPPFLHFDATSQSPTFGVPASGSSIHPSSAHSRQRKWTRSLSARFLSSVYSDGPTRALAMDAPERHRLRGHTRPALPATARGGQGNLTPPVEQETSVAPG